MAPKAILAVAVVLCWALTTVVAGPDFKCQKDSDCKSKNQCTSGKCIKGFCVVQIRPNGHPCTDGNACTIGDVCVKGACRPGVPKQCGDPNNSCKTFKCNPETGNCNEKWKPNGTACDDGLKCTYKDQCVNGACVGIYKVCPGKATQCTKPICNPLTGLCKIYTLPDGAPCNDGNANTIHDRCIQGVCQGTPISG